MGAAITKLRDAGAALRGYPLVIFLACLFGWSLTSMDQSLFGYAIPGIRNEFGAGIEQVGWVLSLSFVFAAFASVAIGILADRFGRRIMFIICLALSALLVGLHALVIGLVSLTVMRMLAFGISNGLSPITNAYVAEAAPARFRGLLVALLQCGYPVGWFVASLFVAPLIATWGWRYIFLPALLVIPIAFLIARYLPESRRFEAARRAAPASTTRQARHFLTTLAPLFHPDFRYKTLACFTAFFLFGGAYAGTAFYFPSYFNEFRGYSIEEATAIVGMSYGVGVLGYFAVAVIGEFYLTRRNTCALWAGLGSLATLALLWLPDSYAEDVFWFALMAGFFYGNAAALSMLLVETFPTHIRATAAGFAGSFALNLGHATFPLAVAYAIPTIGWQWSFTLAVVPSMAIAGLAILTLENVPAGLDLDEATAPG